MPIDPADLPHYLSVRRRNAVATTDKLTFAGCSGVEAIYSNDAMELYIPLNEGVYDTPEPLEGCSDRTENP